MKARHFCTYFDHNYLPRAMVMLESLYAHNPHAIVHVLCLSDTCYDAMQKLAYPYVKLITLPDFEAANPELVAVRPTRSLVEYYFTITPCLPWHILHTVENIDAVTYLDADMMFFSSVEPIFEEAGDASVILTPHRFAPHLVDRVRYGIYNVSWLTFSATQQGLDCLAWYKGKCLDWCFDKAEIIEGEERFADQKYLDYLSRDFAGVHVVQHAGVGVAPWNISNYEILIQTSAVTISGEALIFYHAQQFKQLYKCFYASGFLSYEVEITPIMRKYILSPYCNAYCKYTQKRNTLLGSTKEYSLRGNVEFGILDLFKKISHEFKKKTLIINIDFLSGL